MCDKNNVTNAYTRKYFKSFEIQEGKYCEHISTKSDICLQHMCTTGEKNQMQQNQQKDINRRVDKMLISRRKQHTHTHTNLQNLDLILISIVGVISYYGYYQ